MPYRELDVAGEGEKGVDDENMTVLTGMGIEVPTSVYWRLINANVACVIEKPRGLRGRLYGAFGCRYRRPLLLVNQ